MGSGKSGQQMAAGKLARFQLWIRDRELAKDWTDYWRGDKLSRTDIAAEFRARFPGKDCSRFGRPAFGRRTKPLAR